MALTKKMAKKIADLINDCTVSKIMFESAMNDSALTLDQRNEKTARWRENHDQAAEVLNGILGQEAVIPFRRKAF